MEHSQATPGTTAGLTLGLVIGLALGAGLLYAWNEFRSFAKEMEQRDAERDADVAGA